MTVETDFAFGAQLRALRLAAGLTQSELAARAGVSPDAVAALERGRRQHPRAATVRALSAALGVDIAARLPAGRGDADRQGLPEQARPILGRDRERQEIIDLLSGPARTVTLTGPGGVGKTRLALSVAHEMARSGRWQAHWVRLGTIVDPAAVLPVVATAVGAREGPDPDPVAAVLDRFGGEPTVLVLDNCEHVLPAAARWCAELVSRSGGLRVLATSREPLGADREVLYPVAPLAAPTAGDRPTAANLSRWPATRLFLDRVRDVATDLDIGPGKDEATAQAIARVCRGLDGLPLAIELAAAGLGGMTAGQLAADLDASLRVITRAGAASDRHRTMDAAIAWSYQLLEPAEQVLFGRLSVAAGGWTLDAARRFAAGGDVGPDDVLALMTRLARKSLITLRSRSGLGRYTMLRVIRTYAAGRLEASGEAATVRERHARYYTGLAERAATGLRGPGQQGWLELLDPEVDNLRAARRYWLRTGEADQGLRAATAVWRFEYLRGRYTEGRDLLDAALEVADADPAVDPALRAAAQVAAGTLAYLQCEYDAGTRRVRDGLAGYRAVADVPGMANALQRLGSIARERGSYAEAVALHEEALHLWKTAGDLAGEGDALNYLAFVSWLTGDWQHCDELATQALDRFGGRAESEGAAWALLNLGIASRYRGARGRSGALLLESRQLCERLGYAEGTAWCLDQLGALDRDEGDLDMAWSLQQRSLAMHARVGDRWRSASVLDGLAATAARRERYQTAARLLGTAESLRGSIGTPVPPCEQQERAATVAAVTVGIGPQRYAELIGVLRPERMLARLVSGVNPNETTW
jgi:predicted ATPase/DNA-binding XRE family transcriptional regulator